MFNFFKTKKIVDSKPINGKEDVIKVTKKASPTVGILQQQNVAGQLEMYSSTWNFITNHLNHKLLKLRKQNDSTLLSIEKTNVIRGQIKEIKLLIDILYEKKKSIYIEPKV